MCAEIRVRPIVMSVVGVVALVVALTAGATTSDRENSSLLSVGEPAADAVKLSAKSEPVSASGTGDEGVRVKLVPDRDASVTAVYVASNGSVLVLFPNAEMPDNMLEAGKTYTLFGRDSKIRLRLGKGMPAARIAFYVSEKPFSLDPFKPTPKNGIVVIPASDKPGIERLKDKLAKLAQTPGFNRVVLELKSKSGKGLNLMGIPGAVPSEKPDSVTGVQGLKKKLKE